MKNIIVTAVTILTGLVAFPQPAEAGFTSVGFTYQSGRSSCGCPVYTKRWVAGYDGYRRPVYRYAAVPVVHRCSHYGPRVHYVPSRNYRGPGHGYGSAYGYGHPRGARYHPVPGRGHRGYPGYRGYPDACR